jgi:LuxR family maltose regulon positive regulatory protein
LPGLSTTEPRPSPARQASPESLPPERGLVRRQSLFERLSAAEPGAVILVCAPAGSGKSVLVRSWIEAEGLGERVAWVSVERGERDGQRFWLSVIEALAGVAEGDESIEQVTPSPSFRGDAVIERLLSDLGSLELPIVFVIDDLHELESPDALRWLEAFLVRSPSQLRVLLVTREDPQLGLHRFRLAGRLTELRGPDLRFSLEETRQLVEGAGIVLSDAGVALLHARTEGWAAGLRLAAISLAGHPDPERFVAEFCGSERTVAGYLLAEVLERQTTEVRDLLLRTSVLESVNGSLADALTGGTGAEAILQSLEDANAFVMSLDVGRSWFRYHHLLTDLLQLELRRTSPAVIDSLHRAAAQWFEEHGYPVEAIRHSQAAREWAHAARLLADNSVDLVFDGRKATLRALLAAFPAGVPEADAELALAFATGRLYDGLLEEADAYITTAERLGGAIPDERKRLFDLRLATARLWLACQRGDLVTAKRAMEPFEARSAEELARSNDLRASALMNLGIAELWSRHLVDARRDLEEALALARRIERPYLEIECLGHLALAAVLGSSPPVTGLRLSEQAMTIAEAHGWGTHRILAPAVAAAGGALAWLGRFDEAERWLDRVGHAQPSAEELETDPILHHVRAFLRLGQGRPEEALSEFRAAEASQALLAPEHALPGDVRGWIVLTQALMGHMAATRTELAALGTEERDWAGMRLAAAALELAEGSSQEALDVLAPMIEGVPHALHPRWATVHALLFDAAARDRLLDRRGAEVSIEHALQLAEPDGIILPFMLAPVRELLERHRRKGTAHPTLLSSILDVLSGSSRTGSGAGRPLREELSVAELRVVRYLPSNLKAPEIAAELFVSANTVRTHLRHIYAKLDAHSRSEAVARARELGLLAPAATGR